MTISSAINSLNWLSCPLVMRVSRRLAYSIMATARYTMRHGQSAPKRDSSAWSGVGAGSKPVPTEPISTEPAITEPASTASLYRTRPYTPISYHTGDTPGSSRKGRLVTVLHTR